MLEFDVLVQAALRTVALWAVLDGTLVVSGDLGGSSAMTLLFLVVDLKWHVEHILVLLLVTLTNGYDEIVTYLESIQLVAQVLLLI